MLFASPPVSNKKPLVSASSKLPDLASKRVIVSKVTAGLLLLSSPLNVFVNVPANAVSSVMFDISWYACKVSTLEDMRVALADSFPNLSTAFMYKLNGGFSALTTTLFDFF